jgi:hypothetical protein
MPATVTLSTATLTYAVGSNDRSVIVSSTTGILPGMRLYADGELMTVESLGVSPSVNVRRGTDNTSATSHASGVSLYIGRGDQFYTRDPVGSPSPAIAVSPWINAPAGKIWWRQGDATGASAAGAWWQLQVPTYAVGALGVRTQTVDPSSST